MLIVEQANQLLFLDPDHCAICRRAGCRHAQGLTGKATLSKKVTGVMNSYDRFLALVRDNRDLHRASSQEKDGIGGISLPEDIAVGAVFLNGFPWEIPESMASQSTC